MTTKNELIDSYEEWLAGYKWIWFATLTFGRLDIPPRRADDVFDQWISEVQDEDGAANFHWFRVTELGANRDHLHFHVLVGGLKNGSKWPWSVRWNELAGDCIISYYSPFRGALRYLLKEVRPDQDCAIDFDFDFQLPLPRKAQRPI